MHHTMAVMRATGSGIMLAEQGDELEFVAASEERVVALERHQARLGEGACHEAYSRNEIVRVDDILEEERWPGYAQLMQERGLRAVIGVPLNGFGQTIGVINIYRETPTVWSERDVEAAEILAAMGAGYILNANQLRAQHALSEQLRFAIESRDVIGQAKGILMSQEGVDGDGASDLLRRRSQDTNRKLRQVAREIVERHSDAAP